MFIAITKKTQYIILGIFTLIGIAIPITENVLQQKFICANTTACWIDERAIGIPFLLVFLVAFLNLLLFNGGIFIKHTKKPLNIEKILIKFYIPILLVTLMADIYFTSIYKNQYASFKENTLFINYTDTLGIIPVGKYGISIDSIEQMKLEWSETGGKSHTCYSTPYITLSDNRRIPILFNKDIILQFILSKKNIPYNPNKIEHDRHCYSLWSEIFK